jgi:glycine/serine hydroxymethyltransferase
VIASEYAGQCAGGVGFGATNKYAEGIGQRYYGGCGSSTSPSNGDDRARQLFGADYANAAIPGRRPTSGTIWRCCHRAIISLA